MKFNESSVETIEAQSHFSSQLLPFALFAPLSIFFSINYQFRLNITIRSNAAIRYKKRFYILISLKQTHSFVFQVVSLNMKKKCMSIFVSLFFNNSSEHVLIFQHEDQTIPQTVYGSVNSSVS